MLFFLPGRQIYKTAMCITSKCFNTPLCVKYFFIDRPCLGFISPTRSTRRRTAAAHLPERPQWHLPVPDPQCPDRCRTVLMPFPELFAQKWGRGGQTPARRGSQRQMLHYAVQTSILQLPSVIRIPGTGKLIIAIAARHHTHVSACSAPVCGLACGQQERFDQDLEHLGYGARHRGRNTVTDFSLINCTSASESAQVFSERCTYQFLCYHTKNRPPETF